MSKFYTKYKGTRYNASLVFHEIFNKKKTLVSLFLSLLPAGNNNRVDDDDSWVYLNISREASVKQSRWEFRYNFSFSTVY